MNMIEVKHVVKDYQVGKQSVRALDDVSFTIKKGEFTVILGPSGSGKSTLLNILGGMDQVTEGEVFIEKRDISQSNDSQLTEYRRKEIGFVFQFYNLIPTLNAYENVEIVQNIGNHSFTADDMLTAVGLAERKKHFPEALSGGELQRVSIARALCKNPALILCDEPTGALDTKTGQKIFSLLQKMAHDYQKTVIVVTHNAAVAPAADKVIMIHDGQIQEVIEHSTPLPMDKVVW
ncbi:ABC transporter ATP-binding protein [Isobaculum melis]|uniref:Putative ABC transport system ATP-binding protein n=1 Tax=Isobaculum melis TaxID=142588 RepID=A0A1H9Q5G7_9LACT|nr:ABC transporter ATP-binding protein [Isobaculum melis]SER55806.1 putative ABC transport system ATP-binding protein [Isobaculum melis]